MTCQHFGTCGGCTIAHDTQAALYRTGKENYIAAALKQHGLVHPVDVFIACPPSSRRRIVMGYRREGKNVILGFHGARSHDIVPVSECLVAKPGLVALLPALRELLQDVAPKQMGRVTLLASDSGLDIAISDVKLPDPQTRARLVAAANRMDVARISMNGDVLAEFRSPQLGMGKATVTPPPGGFVQAVKQAEEALASEVVTALKKHKSKSVADLFAGCGAFTFRIAELCRVHAFEGDAHAVEALNHAARHTQGLKPIKGEKRDLFRRPLLPLELKAYDAVVLDPPRQGAQAQIDELVKGKIGLIIYVSCNPGSFARDAFVLLQNGYRIEKLVAVDQFFWSEHVELVAIFTRSR